MYIANTLVYYNIMTLFLNLSNRDGLYSSLKEKSSNQQDPMIFDVTADDPAWYLTGLTDSDGSFVIYLPSTKDKTLTPRFFYRVSSNDNNLVTYLQNTYDPTSVYTTIINNTRTETRTEKGFTPGTYNSYAFECKNVYGFDNFVIPHFLKYPLQTRKAVNFHIFMEAYQLFKSTATPEKTLVLTAFCAYNMNTMGKQRKYKTLEEYCFHKGLNLTKYEADINILSAYINKLETDFNSFYTKLNSTTLDLSFKPCYSYFVGYTQGDGGLSASLGNRFRWQFNINDNEPYLIKRCIDTLNSTACVSPKKGQKSFVTNIMFGIDRLDFLINTIFKTTCWQGQKADVVNFAKEYLLIENKYGRTDPKNKQQKNADLACLIAKIKSTR